VSTGPTRTQVLIAVLVCAGSLTVSGCSGSSDQASRAGSTVTATATVTVSETASGSSSPDSSSPDSSSPDSSSPDSSSPDTATLEPTETSSGPGGGLGPGKEGTRLTLSDFFQPDGWAEGSLNVADRKGVQGIFSEVSGCGYGGRQLELRLEDNYKKLSFQVGQANDSRFNNQTLAVSVQANGKQVIVRNVPFNAVQSFSIPVTSVNSLEVVFRLDPQDPDCGGSVNAVMYNAVLA
jgi:hypothetical protein